MAHPKPERRLDIHNSEVPALCRSCEARHRGVCGALSTEQLLELSRHTHRKSLEAGAELIAESEPVARYSNIIGGVVKLTKLMADGRQQIVGLQFAPDFLGRPFGVYSRVRAEAATGVQVCSFPKASLERLVADNPELEHKLLQQTLKELDEAREWMLTLGRKTAAEKVASFLHLIAAHVDPEADAGESPVVFDLPLSRGDIADFLGLTIETVSRQMTKLRRDGVIIVENNRHVTVPNLGRLSDRAGL